MTTIKFPYNIKWIKERKMLISTTFAVCSLIWFVRAVIFWANFNPLTIWSGRTRTILWLRYNFCYHRSITSFSISWLAPSKSTLERLLLRLLGNRTFLSLTFLSLRMLSKKKSRNSKLQKIFTQFTSNFLSKKKLRKINCVFGLTPWIALLDLPIIGYIKSLFWWESLIGEDQFVGLLVILLRSSKEKTFLNQRLFWDHQLLKRVVPLNII